MDGEDDSLPISALQHWLYCPRQCALIHVERAWSENRFTAEGRLLHERVDLSAHETRRGVRIERGLTIWSQEHGLIGKADVVEFADPSEPPFPIEYKRGRPKPHRADEVQLCAQALCLEEMFDCSVSEGALFYGKTRRRMPVVIDPALRRLTLETIVSARAAIAGGQVPRPIFQPRRCNPCSLIELCRPEVLEKPRAVRAWLGRMLARDGEAGA